MNPLKELLTQGQSIWLDFITRGFIKEGKLKKLIEEDGLRGVTSNPTIFQKAIAEGDEYDADIQSMARAGKSPEAIFDQLAIADIQNACDVLKPVYDQTAGEDGYVSLEVNPQLANDTAKTLSEARRLWKAVDRKNLMIKIPATQEGLGAIQSALSEGINVNITLIFAIKRYAEVIQAWLAGLETAAAQGKDLKSIASVASFFVSRVDSLVDKKLGDANASLHSQAAIANAKLAYEHFQGIIASDRFKRLAAQGARVQRPLWASTSTKNPELSDVLYVEGLIGPHTVNTLPPKTMDAFRDHGTVAQTLTVDVAGARAIIEKVESLGISMHEVTTTLEEQGVKAFADSYDELIAGLKEKEKQLVGA